MNSICYRTIYISWKQYYWMQFTTRVTVINVFWYVAKLVKRNFKNICKLIKIDKKCFCHIPYYRKRLLLRELAIPNCYLLLILFLYMNCDIASFITTIDKLNLSNYEKRHIKQRYHYNWYPRQWHQHITIKSFNFLGLK